MAPFEQVAGAALRTAELYLRLAKEGDDTTAAARLRECRFFLTGLLGKVSKDHAEVRASKLHAALEAVLRDVREREGSA